MIGGVTGDDLGEGAFSGAVWAHDGVDFSRLDFQIDSFQNLGSVFDACL